MEFVLSYYSKTDVRLHWLIQRTQLKGKPRSHFPVEFPHYHFTLPLHHSYSFRSELGRRVSTYTATDHQRPSRIFGAEHTCPKRIRVFSYREDLILEVLPFHVVPRSLLNFYHQATTRTCVTRHTFGEWSIGDIVWSNNYCLPQKLPERGYVHGKRYSSLAGRSGRPSRRHQAVGKKASGTRSK